MNDTGTSAQRDLDLVVWGASGYTGRLVTQAVARRAPPGLRWTVGGRSEEKLKDVLDALPTGSATPAAPLVADAADRDAMATLAGRTHAVVSTVGPYNRYGTPLVEACAAAGTDYADLTAELPWMRRNIDALHAQAHATGARIVHAAGFDSVPSDLGVFVLQQAAIERYGRPCDEIVHLFGPASGGVSGGTIQSGLDLLSGATADPTARQALTDPDLLAPGGTPGESGTGGLKPVWHARHAAWGAPFVMAAVNSKVVRRTRHLLGEPWGNVTYLERTRAKTYARALLISGATAVAGALLVWGPTRKVLTKLLPKPGQGPSERLRREGFFKSELVGHVVDAAGQSNTVHVHTQANADPGYEATARMLAEMGLLLALRETGTPGGVLTPAVAGGEAYVARLNAAGVRILVGD